MRSFVRLRKNKNTSDPKVWLEREDYLVVHQYKNNGYNIVLDVNSGAIHVVDDVTYDVIPMFEAHSREEIVTALQDKYKKEEIEEAAEEIKELKENQELFRRYCGPLEYTQFSDQ